MIPRRLGSTGTHTLLAHAHARHTIDEAITYGLPVDITRGAVMQYSDKLFSNEPMQEAFILQYGKSFVHEGRIIHITTFDDRTTLDDYEGLRSY